MRTKVVAIAAACVAVVAIVAVGAYVGAVGRRLVRGRFDGHDVDDRRPAFGDDPRARDRDDGATRRSASAERPEQGRPRLRRSQLTNAVPQFGRPKGSIIGQDYSTITYLSPTERLVNVQITLPGGGLHLRGTLQVSDPAAVVKIPVISGTRDFAGATGFSEARSAPGNQTLNIYRLKLP